MMEQPAETNANANANNTNIDNWQATIESVIKSTVSVQVDVPRAFDTDSAGSFHATGFVVDKRRGIILTNRHVVSCGPTKSFATFSNQEEVMLKPVYRDPVHDFGFFLYDPEDLKFIDAAQMELCPDLARVGMEIKLIGNDSGERISVLSSTLARLDRAAPFYGTNTYNDFNTFYYQAASGTKGGSSGSAVIDIKGRAVALNAGSRKDTSSAFYLPLWRIVRALNYVKNCIDTKSSIFVPRGTLQTVFVHKSFDELKKLGLSSEVETVARNNQAFENDAAQSSCGMLVVEMIVPLGPADNLLLPGDILIAIDNTNIYTFNDAWNIIDESVGKSLKIHIERGGITKFLNISIQDLHSITPSRFLEVSRASIHTLSYQMAHNYSLPCQGVFVTSPGYMFTRSKLVKYSIIVTFNNIPVKTVEEFAEIYSKLPNGARVGCTFFVVDNRHRLYNTVVPVDKQWHSPAAFYEFNNVSYKWIKTNVTEKSLTTDGTTGGASSGFSVHSSLHSLSSLPLPPLPSTNLSSFSSLASSIHPLHASSPSSAPTPEPIQPEIIFPSSSDNNNNNIPISTIVDDISHNVAKFLVIVEFDTPHATDCLHSSNFIGVGLIVDPSLGLLLVDRNTCPSTLGDALISFANTSIELSGIVIYIPNYHNYALVKYNPYQLPKHSHLHPSKLHFLKKPEISQLPLVKGDEVYVIGLERNHQVLTRKSLVIKIAPLSIEPAASPRYRSINTDVIHLDIPPVSLGAILVSKNENFIASSSSSLSSSSSSSSSSMFSVRGFWASFSYQSIDSGNSRVDDEYFYGLPSELFADIITVICKLLHEEDRYNSRHESIGDGKGGNNKSNGLPSVLGKRDAETMADEKGKELTTNAGSVCLPVSQALEIEMETIMLTLGRALGIPESWLTRYEETTSNSDVKQMLQVIGTLASGHAHGVLKQGDILLTVNDKLVTTFREVELLCGLTVEESIEMAKTHAPCMNDDEDGGCDAIDVVKNGDGSNESNNSTTSIMNKNAFNYTKGRVVNIVLFRDGAVLNVQVHTTLYFGEGGTNRLVRWCGAYLQKPHRAIMESGFLPDNWGVFCSRWYFGSPSHRYQLAALHFITHVNDIPTPNLDIFLHEVNKLTDNQTVRLRLVMLNTKQKLITMRTDDYWWPTVEYKRDSSTLQWNLTQHSNL